MSACSRAGGPKSSTCIKVPLKSKKVGTHFIKVDLEDRQDMQAAANLGWAMGSLDGTHTGADGGLPSQHQW